MNTRQTVSITMHTELSPGIYASERERQASNVTRWSLTGINLRKAVATVGGRREAMKRWYGDIGAGKTYLMLNGSINMPRDFWTFSVLNPADVDWDAEALKLRQWAALTPEQRKVADAEYDRWEDDFAERYAAGTAA